MGFWSNFFNNMPWNSNDPKPVNTSRPESPVYPKAAPQDFRAGVSPTVLANSGNPNKNYSSYQPAQNRTVKNTPTYADPARASRPTQQYLKAWGKGDWQKQNQSYRDFGIDESTLQYGDTGTYKLTDWQKEQAAKDYGLKGDRDVTLGGGTYMKGAVGAEAFAELTPQQQSALRFNRQLLKAVELDRAAQKSGDTSEYDATVREMFGTQGGSLRYAPNTVALLKGMGMGKLRGQDLDEYLSLDRAFDIEEVRGLQSWDQTPELQQWSDEQGGWSGSRSAENMLNLDRKQIDAVGPMIERALADTSIAGWDEQSRIARYLGQTLSEEETPFGWMPWDGSDTAVRSNTEDDNKEKTFQNLYAFVSSRDTTDLSPFWAETESLKFTEEDYNEIFNYFNARSYDADRAGAVDGFRTGQEVRDFIGIG